MRPVSRGRSFAVSSMKPEGSIVAEQILRRGGNAFDAAVAAQAVLALVDASNNGIGSDAMALVWDARTQQPFSINAEGTAPQLATIDWYKKNNGGKLPDNEGLLAGTVPDRGLGVRATPVFLARPQTAPCSTAERAVRRRTR